MHITNIPELIKKHGNMARAAKETGWSEITIAKHRYDTAMENHAVINGVLMFTSKASIAIPPDKW